jgi:predicted kinase
MEHPALILITGLPGSGKTTIARAYSARYQTVHLNSDLLRRELRLMGQYRPEDKEKVYHTLLERTRQTLLEGRDVVVDSTFFKEAIREPFQRVAAECGARWYWVEVRAPERVIRERLQTPRPDSEADFGVYEKIRDAYEPLREPHLVLWSDEKSLAKMAASVHEYVTAGRGPEND